MEAAATPTSGKADRPYGVLLVPGLFRTRGSLRTLADRLKGSGYRVGWVDYRREEAPAVIEARILEAIRQADTPVVIIGHSCGGVLAVSACRHLHTSAKVKGILCLGSPIRGSGTVRALCRHRVGRALLGPAGRHLHVGLGFPRIAVPVSMIAGEKPTVLGRMLGTVSGHNDGTVSVSETAWPGLREHIRLPVNHNGLLTDARTALHALAFLSTGSVLGRFSAHGA